MGGQSAAMLGGHREEKSRICTQIFPTLNFDDDPENVHRAYECPVKCTTWRGTVRLIFEWASDESTQFIITVLAIIQPLVITMYLLCYSIFNSYD